jgi:hypothetical protein
VENGWLEVEAIARRGFTGRGAFDQSSEGRWWGMPRWQQAAWTVVLRLTVVLTAASALIVLASGSALWLVEGDRPDSTLRSWGDALWWSLSTITTVGYGDHVPVTTTGRLIATAVMVVGVAVIGAVAAIVALAIALHVALEEERIFEAQAKTIGQRVEVRLAGIEAQLADLVAHLEASRPTSVNDSALWATRAVASPPRSPEHAVIDPAAARCGQSADRARQVFVRIRCGYGRQVQMYRSS